MNSNDFFADKNLRKKWSVSGLYVIEQPVFISNGKPIFKVGYASENLVVRLTNYRTAYSPLFPFKIHFLYHIPEKVIYQRARYALLSEKVVHLTLEISFGNKIKTEIPNEWYYDLRAIATVMTSLHKQHLKEIKTAKDWPFSNFTYFKERDLKKVKLVSEDSAFSGGILKNLIVPDRVGLDRNKSGTQFLYKTVTSVLDGETIEGKISGYDPYSKKFTIDYSGFSEEISLEKLLQKLDYQTVEEVKPRSEPVIEKRKTRSESRKIELRNRTVKVD
jgi:hypothetical protein